MVALEGNRITIELGDLRSKGLLSPKTELSFTLKEQPAIKVGGGVVTIRHDKKSGTAKTPL